MIYSMVGILGLSKSPADSKKVVLGGVAIPSSSSMTSFPDVTLRPGDEVDPDSEDPFVFRVWLLWYIFSCFAGGGGGVLDPSFPRKKLKNPDRRFELFVVEDV
jgi:hypothetical protein